MKGTYDKKLIKLSKDLTENFSCLSKSDFSEDADVLATTGERLSIAMLYLGQNMKQGTMSDDGQPKYFLENAGFQQSPDVPHISLDFGQHATIWNNEKLRKCIEEATIVPAEPGEFFGSTEGTPSPSTLADSLLKRLFTDVAMLPVESAHFQSKATIMEQFNELRSAADHATMNAKSATIDSHFSLLDQLIESIGSAFKSLKKAQNRRESASKKIKQAADKQDRMFHCFVCWCCFYFLCSYFVFVLHTSSDHAD